MTLSPFFVLVTASVASFDEARVPLEEVQGDAENLFAGRSSDVDDPEEGVERGRRMVKASVVVGRDYGRAENLMILRKLIENDCLPEEALEIDLAD